MGRYDDIIGLEHPTSARHPRMSAIDRAAQFSPFAALTGYEDIICETGRQTDERPELDGEQIQRLNEAVGRIREALASRPEVCGVRFIPDPFKDGGRMEPFRGRVRNIDTAASLLVLTDGTSIPLCDLLEIRETER